MKIDFRELANSTIRHLNPYQPGKMTETVERELGIRDIVKLASNENPLGPSIKAVQAAQDAMTHAHLYPDGACYELKKSLSTLLNIDTEQLVIGNGSENILELIVKTYLKHGDSAVISQYTFLTIPLLIESVGARANVVPTRYWQTDIQGMLNAIDANTRVVFLVNPNNPTGTYTSIADFIYLLNHVPKHIVIVIDEAYADYIECADFPNALDYLSQYSNLIITRTFSKVYGLAALRIGYSISSIDIADMLNRARLPFNVNAIACKAAVAALTDTEHLQKSRDNNQIGMAQLLLGFKKLQLTSIPSICNFVTVEFEDATYIYEQLLVHGIIVRPLYAYQLPNHLRMTIGTQSQNQRLLNTLQHVLEKTVDLIS